MLPSSPTREALGSRSQRAEAGQSSVTNLRFSCCVEMLSSQKDLNARLDLIGRLPFEGVELWGRSGKDPKVIQEWLRLSRKKMILFSGNRNYSLIRREELSGLIDEVVSNMEQARAWGCSRLTLLAEPLQESGAPRVYSTERPSEAFENMVEALKSLAPLAQENGITLLLEPLNSRLDHPGFFLDNPQMGFEAVRRVRSPNVLLLYDVYHMAMMDEPFLDQIASHFDLLGHIHVADSPGRHQPGTGSLNYGAVVKLLKDLGYSQLVGFEFAPLGDDLKALEEALNALS